MTNSAQAPDPPNLGDQPWHPAPDTTRRPVRSVKSVGREILETLLVVVLAFVLFRGLLQNFRVEGRSMEPNFHPGQYLIVNKMTYFHFDANLLPRLLGRDAPPRIVYPFGMPQRGDVVVLEAPTTEVDGAHLDYIKRVVALPGETIQIRGGRVYINGAPLNESIAGGGYLIEATQCNGMRLCQPYVVPSASIVVLGDHRSDSQDSRTWDAEPALPLDNVIGKAWVSYWPRSLWGVVPHASYARSSR